ncbi:hypothetical protein [uncultured Pseudoteredinibacter sp.]|uniref:DUF6923 family protein n=1 Tax=uncultured Pseudoteredinibacter sp. TaxID=1641701 RepID=UPI00262BBAE8|nr:hypothetical protein [uncultured Pseudoteredinibacter sp.]
MKSFHSLMAFSVLCFTVSVKAAPISFGSCPNGFFLSQGDRDAIRLFQGEPDASPAVAFTEVAAPQAAMQDYNALAFREGDGFLYGLQSVTSSALPPGSNARLLRIGANAEVEDLGAIDDMPDDFYLAGDMFPDGRYFVLSATARTTLVAIDLGPEPFAGASATATRISMHDGSGSPREINSGDIAVAGGKLWGLHRNALNEWYLAEVDTLSGEVRLAAAPTGLDVKFGALWGSPNALYGKANDGAGFYRFDLDTGAATRVADSAGAAFNDGASCSSRPPIFGPDVAVSIDNGQTEYRRGQTLSYTIELRNQGISAANNVSVSALLPSAISALSWQCGAQQLGAVCRQASGVGAFSTEIDLPVSASLQFELSFTLAADFSGDLLVSAEANLPLQPLSTIQNEDSDLSNNRAADNDVRALLAMSARAVPSVPMPHWLMFVAMLMLLASRGLRAR